MSALVIELWCDHPDCARGKRILKKALDMAQARKVIAASEVRCPVHGVRTDPLLASRLQDSGSGSESPPGAG